MFEERLKNMTFTKVTPQLPNPGAPLVYVETEEMLDKMMEDLRQYKELAVDLEVIYLQQTLFILESLFSLIYEGIYTQL